MRRSLLPISLLAAGLAAGAVAGPATAAETLIGPSLDGRTATTALSDPNDVVFWSADGPAGIEVPQQGEARAIKLVGGTVQTAEQRKNAQAFDSNYDLVHFIVLRPQGDGTWKSVATSDDLRAPIIGVDGVTDTTVSTLKSENSRVCVKPGDRIALATVGGYVPTADGAGRPIAGFQNGLPYQVFARGGSASTNEFKAGGLIEENKTTIKGQKVGGTELLMQAVIGTGADARFTCQTPEEQKAAAGGGGGGGSSTPKVLPPMATPLLKARKLDKQGTIPVNLSCRAAGTDCAGTIELRAHKVRIGFVKYALAKGASGVFKVKLTKKGRYYVKVASAGKLRTAVVVTANGGRKASGIINIRPLKKTKKKR